MFLTHSPLTVSHPLQHCIIFTLMAFSQVDFPISLFFAEAASLFSKGKALVLLSAPVFLPILPLLVANKIHQRPMAARAADPVDPRTKVV
jgi:hypothetical protein